VLKPQSKNCAITPRNRKGDSCVTPQVKKVVVIGSSGAGKSVFSTRLGEITGLPVIHLDKYHWRAGWTEPPKDEWRRRVEELAGGESWIIDGNFGGTMEIRLAKCDTAILLDLPRHVCTWRVIKRVIKYYGRTRPDLAAECPEKIDLSFIKWVWRFPQDTRPVVIERLSRVADSVSIIRLTSAEQVGQFLASLKSEEKDEHKEHRDKH
jgi:adenylate kinase family enzyme